jgi:hypothetical protein
MSEFKKHPVGAYKKKNVTVYTTKIAEFADKDPRRTYLDFYRTFNLYEMYSEMGFYLILAGCRNFLNQDIKRAVDKMFEIYSNFESDYSNVSHIMVKEMMKQWNVSSPIKITPQILATQYGVTRTVFDNALKSRSKYTVSIYEMITLRLVPDPKNPQTMFNSVESYQTLKTLIMRNIIGDGLHFLTIEQVAEKTGISLEDLKHPEKLCRTRDRYLNAYDLLTVKMPAYDVETLKRRK